MTTADVGPLVLLVLAVVALLAACAASVDESSRRIPDPILLVAGASVVGAAVLGSPVGPLGGAAAAAVPVLLVHLLDPRSIGFGDVKLTAVLGGAVGLLDWRFAVLVPALASTIALVHAGITRRRCMSLGPALVIGYGVAVVVPALGHGA